MKYAKWSNIINLFIIFLSLLEHKVLFANRGNVEQTKPLYTPTQDFPGYFDTNMTPKNKVGFNLPLGSLYYGASENFTFGLNAPLIVYMTNTWRPAFAFNARYRFFSNQKLSSTLTVYGGYFDYKNSKNHIKLYFLNGTYNNSITISENQFLTTQINATYFNYQNNEPNNQEFNKAYLDMVAIALGYNFIFNKKWSIQNIFAIPVLMKYHQEASDSSERISFKNIQNFPIYFRSLANWRIFPESILSFGGFLIIQTEIPFIVLPWIDWSINF